VFKKQDDRGHGDSGRKCRDEVVVDIRTTNMFETSGNSPEDLDWICTLFTPTVAGVQPRGKRQDHNHEGTAECRNEEKNPSCAVSMKHDEGDT